MPHKFIQFADIHEHAHLGNRVQLESDRLQHISGKRSDGQEVLGVRGSDLQRRDSLRVGWQLIDLQVAERNRERLYPFAVMGGKVLASDEAALARKYLFKTPFTVAMFCEPPPSAMTAG